MSLPVGKAFSYLQKNPLEQHPYDPNYDNSQQYVFDLEVVPLIPNPEADTDTAG